MPQKSIFKIIPNIFLSQTKEEEKKAKKKKHHRENGNNNIGDNQKCISRSSKLTPRQTQLLTLSSSSLLQH